MLIPDISNLLGRQIPPVPEVDPRLAQARLLGAVDRLFRNLEQPILLLLEDLHWAVDDLSILKRLLAKVAELPLLIIGTYRSDERRDLPVELPTASNISLEPLSGEDVAALSQAMLGNAGKHPDIVRLLQRETEGNAFFLVEVVRALAEDAGQLSEVGKRQLPETIFAGGVQQVIQRRLNRVPLNARPLLKVAAALGRQLDLNALAATQITAELEGWLADCGDAAVLDVHDGRWRFRTTSCGKVY
jgi:predicted ATPase